MSFCYISCTALSNLRPTGYFNKITYYYNFLSQVIRAQSALSSKISVLIFLDVCLALNKPIHVYYMCFRHVYVMLNVCPNVFQTATRVKGAKVT